MVPHGGAMSRLQGNTGTNMPARYAFGNDLSNNDQKYFIKTFGANGSTGDPAGYWGDGGGHPYVYCSNDDIFCHPNGISGW
jgi:hypothetical protein